jgi:hypothetical protein
MKNMNPYVNAVLAAGYIVGIVFVVSNFTDNPTLEGTLLLPIAMLSLFTLSAAVMGFLFVYKPLQLFLDGSRAEGVRFFARTVLTFALIAAVYVGFIISLVK